MAILRNRGAVEVREVSEFERLQTEADKASFTGTQATKQFRDAIDNLRLAAEQAYSVSYAAFEEAQRYTVLEIGAAQEAADYERQATALEEALGLAPKAEDKNTINSDWLHTALDEVNA